VSPERLRRVDDLLDALAAGAFADDGEDVNVLEHSLQCALLLRRSRAQDVPLQVAGLVHDVGTVLDPDHPDTHAARGALAVEGLLGPRVARLVAQHADAKRYLVTTEPGYAAGLSARSHQTLAAQGGPMDHDELAAWRSMPGLRTVLALRRADDAAKVAGADAGELAGWRAAIEAVAAEAAAGD
jgi:predicted HD phosphohydrolase